MDRALGIHWDVRADTFNSVVSDRCQRETILSSIATVYDPLSLAGPLLLSGRKINQGICRMRYDWNEKLPDELE